MNVFNFDREEFLKTIQQIKKGICVEIGVFKGEYSKKIIEAGAERLYAIDVWKEVENYTDNRNNKYHPFAYADAMKVANLFGDKMIMIRAKSKTAVELFKDESLDFVYIDANHAYEYVKEDIKAWYPKVKNGGIFSGHDYLKIDWYTDKYFQKNKKDKFFYAKNDLVFSGKENSPEFPYFKLGVFGVNPAVDEFCQQENYTLNITNEFFANWWITKK